MVFKAPLRVATLNVRGLNSKQRQFRLYKLMKNRQLDILAIQESKVESEQHTDTMVQPFRRCFDVCVSHAVGTSGGCCLFLRKSLNCVVQGVTACQEGRFISCEFCYERLQLER